ncbi:MAG: Gfo/Idh/MocA family protein [Endozoicomonas sp.]
MIRFAVIGTNWISESFIEAAHQSDKMQLCAVYSRNLENARTFAARYDVSLFFDDLSLLAASDAFDAVYIASPNSLHCQQSILMLESGKHVVCEKPLGSNIAEVEKMYETARRHDHVLFEAYKSAYIPSFKQVKASLPELGRVHKASLHFCQYSSRYQKYLNGENPNTFNSKFSNGSIMDIGYYCVAAAVELFGEPTGIQASAKLLESGVDGHGSVILDYPGFEAVISHSKVSGSNIPNEIQGEEGSLVIDKISGCRKVVMHKRDGSTRDISRESNDNNMIYEAREFARQIADGAMDEQAVARSVAIARVITEIRRQTGVVFPAD